MVSCEQGVSLTSFCSDDSADAPSAQVGPVGVITCSICLPSLDCEGPSGTQVQDVPPSCCAREGDTPHGHLAALDGTLLRIQLHSRRPTRFMESHACNAW